MIMERKAITVSVLNKYLKYKFDQDTNLRSIYLKAEISNYKRHSRGHLYFSLKDDFSQISAVMFAGNTKSLTFEPKEGSKVLVEGYVSVYETAGTYQVYVERMIEEGIGDLYQAYEELKQKLEKEGLFKEDRKKQIPKYPKTVGVITSPTGAAVRDIIHVIEKRYPITKIILYPALVQGAESKDSIVNQIKKANEDKLVDVLIVGRGGGSIEDLWSFNEEVVVRTIATSRIPIISAVGHETDFTISDFVADLRAATPSQAAELAVPDQKNLLQMITDTESKLNSILLKELQIKKRMFEQISSSVMLLEPTRILQNKNMVLDHLIERLTQTTPLKQLELEKVNLSSFTTRFQTAYLNQLKHTKLSLSSLFEKLDLVNPLHIMKKGFAIVKQEEDIKISLSEIDASKELDIIMHDGTIQAKIIKMKKGE